MLYQALGNGTFGPAVRLEQELIRWDWAEQRLAVGASGWWRHGSEPRERLGCQRDRPQAPEIEDVSMYERDDYAASRRRVTQG
ncbi:hypothetical protein [Arthrobacter sp. Bi26]|uniref:hypothetical protein n=1 Tax=Arthrobacter sp. Bi26 TaxID=2822350 RepID=UPI0033AA84DF